MELNWVDKPNQKRREKNDENKGRRDKAQIIQTQT